MLKIERPHHQKTPDAPSALPHGSFEEGKRKEGKGLIIPGKLLFLIAVAIIAASCGTETVKMVTTWQERQVGGKWIGRIVLTPVETQDS